MPAMSLYSHVPSGYVNTLPLKMAIEILDLPSDSMAIFHSCVSLPEGMSVNECMCMTLSFCLRANILSCFHVCMHWSVYVKLDQCPQIFRVPTGKLT